MVLTTFKYGEESCGRDPATDVKHQIPDGNPVVLHSAPWIAHFYFKSSYMCDGALITRSHVLSAAHCSHVFSHTVLGDYDDYHLKIKDGEEQYRITKWHYHPRGHWFADTNGVGAVINDFALAELILPVIFSHSINTICLPPKENIDYKMKNLATSVWDSTRWKGKHPPKMRTTTVAIMSDSQCRETWNKHWSKRFKAQYNSSILLCSYDTEKYEKDACLINSGGKRSRGFK